MSWVRLESTNGLRMSAPSFAPPPTLEGFDKLFQPPVQLRRLHSFTHLTPAAGWEEEDTRSEEVLVLLDNISLGGRVGDVCIAAGGNQMSESALEVLLECTVALLRSTSENGLQVVLDALCTRPPGRVDIAPRLLEQDGLSHVGDSSEALISSAAYGQTKAELSKGNRHFLNHIRQEVHQAKKGDQLGERDASSGPADTAEATDQTRFCGNTSRALHIPGQCCSSGTLSTANFFAKVLTRGIHYARRQALLYFMKLDTIPLSTLWSRVNREQDVAIYLPRARTATDVAALVGQPALSVRSTLRRSDRLQEKNGKTALWRETMERSEEVGQLLLLAVQRTLCGCFPFHADLFGKDMWGKTHRSTVHTPLFAAFSTSGLLVGSGTFYHVLSHRERFLLTAVAMNALACSPMSRPYTFSSSTCSAEKKHLNWSMGVVQLPLLVATPLAGVDTLDLCCFSVGDALSVVIGVSRTIQQQRGITVHTLAECLRKGASSGIRERTTAVPPNLGTAYFHNLSYHLHTLCQHSLSPTQEFYSSVCSLAVLENSLYFDKKAEELEVSQTLKDSLSRSGWQYYDDGVVFDDGVEENPPPLHRAACGDPSPLAEEETAVDVGCLCCLPFSRKKKPEAVEQDAFAAHRVQMAKSKLRKAKATYARDSAATDSPAPPREVLSFYRRVLLTTLPLHAMWFFVGAHVALAELLAFRSLEGSPVHSAFWVQRSMPARQDATAHYCVGFFRPRVEDSYCYRLPGEADGSGEQQQRAVLCLQDPAATLDVALPLRSSIAMHARGDTETQVSVFPLTALEVMVPSPLHAINGSDGHALRGAGPVVEVADDVGLGEEARLTSIYLSMEEKLRLKKHKKFGRAAQNPQTVGASGSEDATESADAVLFAGGGRPVSPGEVAAAALAERKLTSYLRVEEVVNIEDDLLGEEWNILRSMEKRRQPKAFNDNRDPDLFDAPHVNQDMRDLCVELSLCKEAVMALFTGALVH